MTFSDLAKYSVTRSIAQSLCDSSASYSVLQDGIITSQVRVLQALLEMQKQLYSIVSYRVLSGLENKSSELYLSVLPEIMLKIFWLSFFCGHCTL